MSRGLDRMWAQALRGLGSEGRLPAASQTHSCAHTGTRVHACAHMRTPHRHIPHIHTIS